VAHLPGAMCTGLIYDVASYCLQDVVAPARGVAPWLDEGSGPTVGISRAAEHSEAASAGSAGLAAACRKS